MTNKKETQKKEIMEEALFRGEEFRRIVDYQVDTITNSHGAAAYYNSPSNSVTINYKKNNEYFNKHSQSLSTIVHEQKHRDNYNNGMYKYIVSPEMAYKVEMHDEISANMASLIALRQKYLETGDISVFNEQGEDFKFYSDAIKKHKIDPYSTKPDSFDKEMRFIVNETQKMWLSNHSKFYIPYGISSAEYYGDKTGEHSRYWDENYKDAMKVAYNIGGVDFTKYMDKDIEITEKGEKAFAEKFPLLLEDDDIKWTKRAEYAFNTAAPIYPEWENEEGKRRSSVQYRSIPDLTKPIIKQPGMVDEIYEQMKRDKEKANSLILFLEDEQTAVANPQAEKSAAQQTDKFIFSVLKNKKQKTL